MFNHSADDKSQPRACERSWLDNDGFSNDEISQQPSYTKAGQAPAGGSTNSKGHVLSSDIIPDRRRKYLSNNGNNDDTPPYAKAIVDESKDVDTYEAKAIKKRKNVHLQPLEHKPDKRNKSVSPNDNVGPAAPHPLNFAPSPHG